MKISFSKSVQACVTLSRLYVGVIFHEYLNFKEVPLSQLTYRLYISNCRVIALCIGRQKLTELEIGRIQTNTKMTTFSI